MSVAILERPAVRRQALRVSVEHYHRMRDLGLVPVKSELLDGVVVEKMSNLHALFLSTPPLGMSLELSGVFE